MKKVPGTLLIVLAGAAIFSGCATDRDKRAVVDELTALNYRVWDGAYSEAQLLGLGVPRGDGSDLLVYIEASRFEKNHLFWSYAQVMRILVEGAGLTEKSARAQLRYLYKSGGCLWIQSRRPKADGWYKTIFISL